MAKTLYRIEVLLDDELIDKHGISAFDEGEQVSEGEMEVLRCENIKFALEQCKDLVEMGMELKQLYIY